MSEPEPVADPVRAAPAVADRPQGPAVSKASAARFLRPLGWLVAGVAGALLLVCCSFGITRAASSGRALQGVHVAHVALSGLDRDGARAALEPALGRLGRRDLKLDIGGALVELDPAAVGFAPSMERTLDAALGAGRSGSVVSQFGFWLDSFFVGHTLSFRADIDSERLLAELRRLEASAVSLPPFEGGVVLEDGKLRLKPPRAGLVMDHQRTAAAVEEALTEGKFRVARAVLVERQPRVTLAEAERALSDAEALVARPVTLSHEAEEVSVAFKTEELRSAVRTRPGSGGGLELYFDSEAIDKKLKALRAGLEDEPKSARFVVERDQIKIEPSRPGTLLDAAEVATELLKATRAGKSSGTLPIKRSAPPSFSTEDAEALGIRRLVASFTTYHQCCEKRVQNIHLIADLLNDTVIKPGERFSVNEFIGPRTQGKGFVEAPTISRGEMVDSYGGGISQFATTLFNAVLDGGYAIIQRQPHSYYFTRYPEGHEATLSFPVPDLIFRNDTSAGMLLKIEKGPTFIRVKIFGDHGGRKVRRIVSRRFDIVKPEVEYEADDTMDPEDEKVLYGGMDGWSVVATRIITYPDGKKHEEGRKVVYKPRTRIVKVHSCKIPKDYTGYTGDRCPEPEVPDGGAEGGATEGLVGAGPAEPLEPAD